MGVTDNTRGHSYQGHHWHKGCHNPGAYHRHDGHHEQCKTHSHQGHHGHRVFSLEFI